MIFNQFCGGKRKVLCTFLGAVGEELTFSSKGKTFGPYPENTEIELSQGDYYVTGSESGYTKRITVKAPGTYTAYPDGAIYWYGRELFPITAVGVNGSAVLERKTNCLYVYTSGQKTESATFTSTAEPVDFTGYATCKIVTCPVQTTTESSLTVANRYAGVNSSLVASYDKVLTLQKNFSSTEKAEYSFDILSMESGYPGIRTNDYQGGYTRVRAFNLYAIYLDGKVEGNLRTFERTTTINNTYRYCNQLYTSDFVRVGSLGSDMQGISYVGTGEEDYNAMMVPVSGFSYPGDVAQLEMQLYLWMSPGDSHRYRWAVTTSRANEALYKSVGAVTDANQIGAGIFTPEPISGYTEQTFMLPCENIPQDTDLYLYLWRDSTAYSNIHVMRDVTVILTYAE